MKYVPATTPTQSIWAELWDGSRKQYDAIRDMLFDEAPEFTISETFEQAELDGVLTVSSPKKKISYSTGFYVILAFREDRVSKIIYRATTLADYKKDNDWNSFQQVEPRLYESVLAYDPSWGAVRLGVLTSEGFRSTQPQKVGRDSTMLFDTLIGPPPMYWRPLPKEPYK